MLIFKNKLGFIVILIFLSSCTSMNITEENVYSDNIKTVEASSESLESIQYNNKAVLTNATVYFEFDKSSLTSRSLQILKSVVEALNENLSVTVTLAGHADERGTREYNLALGQRRAEAVSSYLYLNGISKDRISVKSYGEERPAVTGQNERSYARNRRVEIN